MNFVGGQIPLGRVCRYDTRHEVGADEATMDTCLMDDSCLR